MLTLLGLDTAHCIRSRAQSTKTDTLVSNDNLISHSLQSIWQTRRPLEAEKILFVIKYGLNYYVTLRIKN